MLINHNKAMACSQEIIKIGSELKILCDEMDNIMNGISLGISTENIKCQLKSLICSMEGGIEATNSLGDALALIVKKYKETEDLVVSNIKSAMGKPANSAESVSAMSIKGTGTDKRGFWSRLWGWICGDEADEYEATGSEQEKAADLKMKKELWNVLQEDKYSDANWATYTIDEKKQVLQEYMDSAIEVYGLKDVESEIVWDPLATYELGSITWGYYTHEYHTVTLNEAALSDSIGGWDSYKLLRTVSHELRHAYQHEAIDYPEEYMVSKETIDNWKNTFKNYISSDEDYVKYRSQDVEVDARDFEVLRSDVY